MQLLLSTFMTAYLITASTFQMHAAEKNLYWTPEVLMSTKSISDVQISPDHNSTVPVLQSCEFYHALDRLGKETTLALYPGMEHCLADPNMQLDAMKRNLAWFQNHLQKH